MEDNHSLGGAGPGGFVPIIRERTRHDIAEGQSSYESSQIATRSKASGTLNQHDGPPSPKRQKLGSDLLDREANPFDEVPTHRDGPDCNEPSTVHNAAGIIPSDFNIADYNRRNSDLVNLEDANPDTAASSLEEPRPRRKDPVSFDNSNEKDAEPSQLTAQTRSTRRANVSRAILDDGNGADEDDDESPELAAKFRSLREPEELTATQLLEKAGLGQSSRLAQHLKSKGHDDNVMVCRGGWSDYEPPKAQEPVMKRPRGRPRINAEGTKRPRGRPKAYAEGPKRPRGRPRIHAEGTKRNYNRNAIRGSTSMEPQVANADQQSGLTTELEVTEKSSQNLNGSTLPVAAEVDSSSVTTGMELRKPESIGLPSRYSNGRFAKVKDDPKRPHTRRNGARPPSQIVTSTAAATAEFTNLSRDFQDPGNQVSTPATFSTLGGKSIFPPESIQAKMNRSHTRGGGIRRSGARSNGVGRRSSAAQMSSALVAPQENEASVPAMIMPEGLYHELGNEVTAMPNLATSSQTSEGTISATPRIGESKQGEPGDKASPQRKDDVENASTPSSDTASTTPLATSTLPAIPSVQRIASPQRRGWITRKANQAASTPLLDAASTVSPAASGLSATPSTQRVASPQRRGWITRKANQEAKARQEAEQIAAANTTTKRRRTTLH